MATKEEVEIAFQIITQGERAKISDQDKRALFGTNPDAQMRAIRENAERWIGSGPVQGLAVGTRTRAGRREQEFVIVVFVDEKKPPSRVQVLIPPEITIPNQAAVKTDVVAIGRLKPEVFSDHVRPAMPGCSIGHHALATYGTFGLLVRKRTVQGGPTGAPFILSNSHVLALDGLASQGDDIIQPGPYDVTYANGAIAQLEQWVPFDFVTPGFPNLVDAAIARTVRPDIANNCIRKIDIVPTAISYNITEGMKVHKVGRTSDYTVGEVLYPSCSIMLPHMQSPTAAGIVWYADQVMCTRYTIDGDSGSAVLNDKNEVVGLHAAGSVSVSTFNKIEHVFSLLGLTLA